MPTVDTHPLNEIRVYLLESSKKIRVRNCVNNTNDDYDLLNTEVGLKISSGALVIGDGVSISNSTSLPSTFALGTTQTQAYFVHVIDDSADDTSMDDEANQLEYFGTLDDRDECELVGIGKPRRAYRIDITTTDITMKIDNLNNLTVKYDGNSSNGVQHVITTNIEPVN